MGRIRGIGVSLGSLLASDTTLKRLRVIRVVRLDNAVVGTSDVVGWSRVVFGVPCSRFTYGPGLGLPFASFVTRARYFFVPQVLVVLFVMKGIVGKKTESLASRRFAGVVAAREVDG